MRHVALSWMVVCTCGALGLAACAQNEDEVDPLVERDALTTTFVVDDDGAQCPGARFQTIQSAVDAAPAGSIVQVCAGTYEEDVVVRKTLTLRGAKFGQDARSRTLASTGESVVIHDRPFFLGADDIVLDGFTVIVVVDESGEGHGIQTSNDFSGYRVINNVADADGVTALFPGSNGVKQSLARHNHFYNRLGIAGSPDEPTVLPNNLLISENLFTNSSLLVTQASNVIVRGNKLEVNGGILVATAQHVRITGNKVLRSAEVAIAVSDLTQDVVVENNMLRDGRAAGIVAVEVGEGISITGNRVAGFEGTGIVLVGSSRVSVRLNEVEDGHEAIRVQTGEGNLIEANNVEDNDVVGIRVTGSAMNNRIAGNEVRGNGPPDCLDETQGTQTAGTANTWVNNEGSTSSPAGLCFDVVSSPSAR